MNINYKMVTGVLLIVVAYENIIHNENRKRFISNQAALKRSHDREDYYINKLNEEKIPMTAFDKIALDAISDQ